MMLFAFKVQHRIHHVFQHPRSGNRAFLSHVTYDENRNAIGLGDFQQLGGSFPHLAHGTRHTGNIRLSHSLNRVDNYIIRLDFPNGTANLVHIRLSI